MDTEIKNAVNAADQDAQYDAKAKRLLGNKSFWRIFRRRLLMSSGEWIRKRQ